MTVSKPTVSGGYIHLAAHGCDARETPVIIDAVIIDVGAVAAWQSPGVSQTVTESDVATADRATGLPCLGLSDRQAWHTTDAGHAGRGW